MKKFFGKVIAFFKNLFSLEVGGLFSKISKHVVFEAVYWGFLGIMVAFYIKVSVGANAFAQFWHNFIFITWFILYLFFVRRSFTMKIKEWLKKRLNKE